MAKKKLNSITENEKLIFYDEFSITNRPTLFYGWAKTNTRFNVKSDERKRDKTNGLLAVDAITGEEYIQLKKTAKAEDVAQYFYELCEDIQNENYDKLTIILDNNPTHKDKMRYNLWLRIKENKKLENLKIDFKYTPAYSPDFNLAEYIIHLLRLNLLHHIPLKTKLEDIEIKISNFFNHN